VGYRINWDDGGPITVVPPTGTDNAITVERPYQDNSVPGETTTISVVPFDDKGTYDAVTKEITVNNVAPTLSNLAAMQSMGLNVIVEGDSVSLTGTIADVGALDSFTLEIDWDDDEPVDQSDLPARTTSFDAVHRFRNDGEFNVAITLTDDDGLSATAEVTVIVDNAAPTVAFTLTPTTGEEGGEVVLNATIADIGEDDDHNVEITWGDGEVTTVSLPGRTFSVPHVYADNDPSFDPYQVSVRVVDADDPDSSVTESETITVLNVAPTIETIVSSAADIADAVAIGEDVTLTSTFSDPALENDDYTVTIDWGDTTTSGGTLSFDALTGTWTVQGTHAYSSDGIYNISITVADDDGGISASESARALVGTFTNNAPVIADQTFSVAENSPVGTIVGTVVATDEAAVTFELVDPNAMPAPGASAEPAEFAIDPDTGVITVRDDLLDAETNATYEVTAIVTDFFGETSEATITINITNVNEFAPVLTLNEYFFEIDENTANGTVIDTAEATDDDFGDSVSFSLDTGMPFAIAADTGVITVADSSRLDFETTPVFTVDVTATDTGGKTDTRRIYIRLRDVDESIVTPEVVDLTIDDGTGQRSVVREITITFNEVVSIAPGAFTILKDGTEAITPTVSTDDSPGYTVATLTFEGSEFTGGSLADGNYQLTINSGLVTIDSTAMANDVTDEFFRFFGDHDGDRDVDLLDLNALRATYRRTDSQVGFDSAFDYDNDGDVDLLDLNIFRTNYRQRLDA
ncbi:MAG: cadherin domain-containing protein, partial [Planctomycetota bacterium]